MALQYMYTCLCRLVLIVITNVVYMPYACVFGKPMIAEILLKNKNNLLEKQILILLQIAKLQDILKIY